MLEPRDHVLDEHLQLLDIGGNVARQPESLLKQERDNKQEDSQQRQHGQQHHNQCCKPAMELAALKPVDERVEQIGQRDAENEWQQNAAEDPQQDPQND